MCGHSTFEVQETLDYFYNAMMDKERVAPNLFCYQAVIGVCARNGYLTQAFDLYREVTAGLMRSFPVRTKISHAR